MTWRLGLIVVLAAAIVVAAAGCDGGEPADTPTPDAAAVQSAETATLSPPAVVPTAAVTPTAANTPVPGVDLHDTQVVTSPGRMRNTLAPWRDGGGNRLFSTHVFGAPFMLNEKGELLPWVGTGITANEDYTVWMLKLREDAVFQDGTPITRPTSSSTGSTGLGRRTVRPGAARV